MGLEIQHAQSFPPLTSSDVDESNVYGGLYAPVTAKAASTILQLFTVLADKLLTAQLRLSNVLQCIMVDLILTLYQALYHERN